MKISKKQLSKIIKEELKEAELGRPYEGETLSNYQIALEETISELMRKVDFLERRVTDLERLVITGS
jgi:polyhydroxyalkanoate synthesis regulator phasin